MLEDAIAHVDERIRDYSAREPRWRDERLANEHVLEELKSVRVALERDRQEFERRSVVVDQPGRPVAAPCAIDGCQHTLSDDRTVVRPLFAIASTHAGTLYGRFSGRWAYSESLDGAKLFDSRWKAEVAKQALEQDMNEMERTRSGVGCHLSVVEVESILRVKKAE